MWLSDDSFSNEYKKKLPRFAEESQYMDGLVSTGNKFPNAILIIKNSN
jgi:hypothetical protein